MKITVECTDEGRRQARIIQAFAEGLDPDVVVSVCNSEEPDKELLRAIKLLIRQYEHSWHSEYVRNPVAHALFHTWRQVDEKKQSF